MIPFVDLKTQYQAMKSDIDQAIQKVLDHGGFINGPEVAQLEQELVEFTGAKHALACSSGTDALLIPMMAAGIQPGDEVITTAFSFIATVEMIVLLGATPVYVDIDPETFNLDVEHVKAAITDKTKAIVPVSLYGQMPDMDEINTLAKQHGLIVFEDAAQSFGATYKGKRSCAVSDFGATSFFPAKPLGAYGDGGAIFTNSDEMAVAMKEVREHGSESRYHHTRLGINGRLDTIQCAILSVKLKRYQWEIEQRQRVATAYNQAFQEIINDEVKIPVVRDDRDSVWAQYTLRVPKRDDFRAKMQEAGVPTAVHYPCPMPDQPFYKGIGRVHSVEEAQKAANQVVSLPMFPDMNEDQQATVISAVLSYFKK